LLSKTAPRAPHGTFKQKSTLQLHGRLPQLPQSQSSHLSTTRLLPANPIYQTIVLPLLLAATIYALLTFLLLPLYRRHHQRYAQYVPLNTITSTTTTAASRVTSFFRDRLLPRIFLPSNWAFNNRRQTEHAGDDDDGNSLFGSEEGEGMVGFDVGNERRNRAQGGGGRQEDGRPNVLADSDRRLSRELEEGFRDDSDDEDSGTSGARRQRLGR
jgi:hypothetical protein